MARSKTSNFSKDNIDSMKMLYDLMSEMSHKTGKSDEVQGHYEESAEMMAEKLFEMLAEKYPDSYSAEIKDDESEILDFEIEDIKLSSNIDRKQYAKDILGSAMTSIMLTKNADLDKSNLPSSETIYMPGKKKMAAYKKSLFHALDRSIEEKEFKKNHKWGILIKVPREHFMAMQIVIDAMYIEGIIDLPCGNSYENSYKGFHFYLIQDTEKSTKLRVCFTKLKDLQLTMDLAYKQIDKILSKKK